MDDTVVSALLDSLATLPPLGDWIADAACRGQADVFTERPDDLEALALLERVCRRCPVVEQCRSFAGTDRVHGLYGGAFHDWSTRRVWRLPEAA